MTFLLALSLVLADPPTESIELESSSQPAVKLGSDGESCIEAADCAADLVCTKNTCVPPGTFELCQRAADCPGSLQCRQNVCLPHGMKPPQPKATPQQSFPPQDLSNMLAPYLPKRELPYREGMVVPLGFHVETRARLGIWVTGFSIWASAWVVAGIMGSLGLGSPLAFVPVFGSFLGALTVPQNFVGPTLAAQIPLGLIQALGAGMFIGGLVAKKKVLVLGSAQATIAPVVTDRSQGLALLGSF